MKKILIEILQELKSINKKLQAIESSKEQNRVYQLDNESTAVLLVCNEKSASVQIIKSTGIQNMKLNRQV